MKLVRKTKKKFYPVIAPKIFNEQELGEIPLYDLRDAIGRTLKFNLMTLTNDPKKQHINISFQINNVDDQKAKTEVIGYTIIPSSIRRRIKRKKIRIDDSFVVKTKDNKLVRIKPFLITAGFARSSALKGLKYNLRSILTKDIAKIDYNDLVKELISYRLQKELREKLKKIYPLAVCEIRVMEIEKEKKEEEVEEKVKEIKEEKEVKEIKKEEKVKKEIKEEKKTVSKK